MLVACSTQCFWPHGWIEALDSIGAAGLTAVELCLSPAGTAEEGRIPAALTPEAAEQWGKQLQQRGLTAVGVNAVLHNPWQMQPAWLAQQIAATGQLGAKSLLMRALEESDRAARQRWIEQIRQAADVAQPLGVSLILDPRGIHAREMAEVMQEVADVRVQLNFDPAHYLVYNYNSNEEVALQKVVSWLGSVRLKDTRGVYRELYFPALGEGGGVDFFRLKQILESSGYRGPCVIEFGGAEREGPPDLSSCHERLCRSLEFLRGCGWPV